jgi:hypothetical protein
LTAITTKLPLAIGAVVVNVKLDPLPVVVEPISVGVPIAVTPVNEADMIAGDPAEAEAATPGIAGSTWPPVAAEVVAEAPTRVVRARM